MKRLMLLARNSKFHKKSFLIIFHSVVLAWAVLRTRTVTSGCLVGVFIFCQSINQYSFNGKYFQLSELTQPQLVAVSVQFERFMTSLISKFYICIFLFVHLFIHKLILCTLLCYRSPD